jgi:hypothetical protein
MDDIQSKIYWKLEPFRSSSKQLIHKLDNEKSSTSSSQALRCTVATSQNSAP